MVSSTSLQKQKRRKIRKKKEKKATHNYATVTFVLYHIFVSDENVPFLLILINNATLTYSCGGIKKSTSSSLFKLRKNTLEDGSSSTTTDGEKPASSNANCSGDALFTQPLEDKF